MCRKRDWRAKPGSSRSSIWLRNFRLRLPPASSSPFSGSPDPSRAIRRRPAAGWQPGLSYAVVPCVLKLTTATWLWLDRTQLDPAPSGMRGAFR
jgi:hypothetical protein